MARVIVTPTAVDDLRRLVVTHSLPTDTIARVKRSLEPLATFPLLGASLDGRWQDFRFLLGPWRWLLVVYIYDEAADAVYVVSFQDGRSAASATSDRPGQQP